MPPPAASARSKAAKPCSTVSGAMPERAMRAVIFQRLAELLHRVLLHGRFSGRLLRLVDLLDLRLPIGVVAEAGRDACRRQPVREIVF